MPSHKTTGPRACQFCSRVFPTGTHRSVVTEHRKCCASNPLQRRLQCPCGFAMHHFGVHRRHRLKCRASVAGECFDITIQSFDKCGRMRKTGGDDYLVRIVGPLHLHTNATDLIVSSGNIADHREARRQ
ncbi:hypothetical protein RI054_19g87880 [Pseudoscourfieldia marina]